MNTIVQWNCRGFRNNFNGISILAHDLNPAAFCLQETYYKNTDTQVLRLFDMYNCYAKGASVHVGVHPCSYDKAYYPA